MMSISNQVVLVELNYEVTPIHIRENISSKKTEVEHCFNSMGQIFVMATCHRFTLLTLAFDETALIRPLAKMAPELKKEHLLILTGEQAVNHWFGTACGLKSRTVGEHEIQGQVRKAFAKSEQLGAELNELVKRAIHVGKRARTETGIGRYATSLTAITRDRIHTSYPNTSDLIVIIFGTGEMSRLILQMLKGLSVREIWVVSKDQARAKHICTSGNMKAIALSEVNQCLKQADVLIGATWTNKYLVEAQDLTNDSNQLLIDLGMPRNFDPDINDHPSNQLLDLNTLNKAAESAKVKRNEEVDQVGNIIEQAVMEYHNWLKFRVLIPEVRSLRFEVDELRDRFCQKVNEEMFDLSKREKEQLIYRFKGITQQHFSKIIDVLKSDLPEMQKVTSKLEILHAFYAAMDEIWHEGKLYKGSNLNHFELMAI